MENQKRKKGLGFFVSLLIMLVLSVVICLVQFYISPSGVAGGLRFCFEQPILFILNGFPVVVVLGILWMLFGNVFTAGAVGGAIFFIFSYVNLLKIEGRDDPLVPADFALVREALNSVEEFNLDMHWGKVIIFAAIIVLLILLAILVKPKEKMSWLVRGTVVVVLLACFIYSFGRVYRRKGIYDNLKVETPYNITCVYNTLGLNYSFLYNCNLYPIDKPADFNKEAVALWDTDDRPAETEITPNIIFIMGEAFSDLADEKMFAYTAENSPLKAYHTLCESPLAINGHIIVPNYAAGTANTEFDVLTGMQTNMVGEGTTSSFRTVRNNTRNMATVLKSNGYDTFFMHPGQSWFYNRSSVYKYLGMADQVFADSFDESDYKGQMISDEAFLDELKADLKTRMLENDKPLFTYSVTIENHQSYNYWKFPDIRYDKIQLDKSIGVDEVAMENLEVYMEGCKDTAEMVLSLSEYLDSVDEPTLLVFFGDHRPNLVGTYPELGIDYETAQGEAILDQYSVPFVIKANEAYAKVFNITKAFEDSGLDGARLSANYLGAAVLELTGFGKTDAYFGMLNEMRREIPVLRIKESVYITDEGFTEKLSEEDQALVDKMHTWMYYRLKFSAK